LIASNTKRNNRFVQFLNCAESLLGI
jgi:hypothetical protein